MRLQYKFKFIKNKHKFLISKIEKNDISQKYIKSINQSKFLRYNIKSLINKKLQIEYIDKINNSEDNIIIGIFNKGKLYG